VLAAGTNGSASRGRRTDAARGTSGDRAATGVYRSDGRRGARPGWNGGGKYSRRCI
jgi:hypothetical protein